MIRRRAMESVAKGEDEMKAWKQVVNFSGPVDVEGAFSTDCFDTSGMTEFKIILEIGKDTGGHYTANGNAGVTIEKLGLGYFAFNVNWSSGGMNYWVDVITEPFDRLMQAKSVNSLTFNWAQMNVQGQLTHNAGDGEYGKFKVTFPNGYTGTITAKVWGR